MSEFDLKFELLKKYVNAESEEFRNLRRTIDYKLLAPQDVQKFVNIVKLRNEYLKQILNS